MLTMRPPGNLLDGLRQFIATLPDKCTVVEVGCYRGESTLEFLKRAAVVVCVDPWQDWTDLNDGVPSRGVQTRQAEDAFDAAVKPFYGRVCKLKMQSVAASLILAGMSFDCVYIDGSHEEAAVAGDITVWMPHIKPGGVLACHDYGNVPFTGVQRAVDKKFPKQGKVFPDFTWALQIGKSGKVQG